MVAVVIAPGTGLGGVVEDRLAIAGRGADGIVIAERTPARHRQSVRKRIDFDCRTINRLKPESSAGATALMDGPRILWSDGFRRKDGNGGIFR